MRPADEDPQQARSEKSATLPPEEGQAMLIATLLTRRPRIVSPVFRGS